MVPEAGKNGKWHRFPIDGWRIITFVSYLIIPLLLCSYAGSPPNGSVAKAKRAIERSEPILGDRRDHGNPVEFRNIWLVEL